MSVEVDLVLNFRCIGLLGYGLFMAVYALLALHVVRGDSLIFFTGNTLSAAFVLASNFGAFNLGSVLIQIIFIFIALSAMILRFLEDTQPAGPSFEDV